MPEGPTILMMREQADRFRGKVVRHATGNAKIDIARMEGKRVKSIRTWGKHFLLEFAGFTVRVHLLLFGSYRIDDPKDVAPRLALAFDNGELAFYSCSVKIIKGPLDDAYDWSADVLSDHWSARKAIARLRARPEMLACDALLDQDLFAGVGNIIKNEVLFRQRIHPESLVGAMPAKALAAMVADARDFSFQFLAWRRAGVLKKNCQVHNKSTCPRCGVRLQLRELGKTHRRAFYCLGCQVRYPAVEEPSAFSLTSPATRKVRKTTKAAKRR